MSTSSNRRGGSGGAGEGASYSPAGTADRYVVVGPAGTTILSGELRRGAARGEVSIGTSNPVDWSGVVSGLSAPFQIHKNTATAIEGYAVYNSGGGGANGGSGFIAGGGSAPNTVFYVQGNSAGTFLGVSLAQKTVLKSFNGVVLIGSSGLHDVVFGAGDAEHIRLDGASASVGMKAVKPITLVPTALSGAAIATTGAIGVPAYFFSAPGANRTFNLPALAGAIDGYPVEFRVVGSIGGFTITLDGNGAETIDGAATYDLVGDRAKIKLIRVSATAWQTSP